MTRPSTTRANQRRTLPGVRACPPRVRLPALSFCVVMLAGFAAPGCVPGDREINSFIHDWEASVSATDYRVQPPDTLEISASHAEEIDGEHQTIRQDGKISLRLLGEVKVSGMTPVEIARKLESLLAKYYSDPNVNVRVLSPKSKRYYVFGQVTREGAYQYTGRDTLLHALSQAQPTFMAWKSQVKVIHPSHDENKRRVVTVDVDRIMKEGKLDQNFLLAEGDIIYVPPTPIAWVGLRLQELLGPMQPVATTLGLPGDTITTVDEYQDITK